MNALFDLPDSAKKIQAQTLRTFQIELKSKWYKLVNDASDTLSTTLSRHRVRPRYSSLGGKRTAPMSPMGFQPRFKWRNRLNCSKAQTTGQPFGYPLKPVAGQREHFNAGRKETTIERKGGEPSRSTAMAGSISSSRWTPTVAKLIVGQIERLQRSQWKK
ncbi:hypothetical protein M514_07408 [Trichuris suis]|uniref:Uncharacterized protein n=1 Tax=Trichuris suis TaxID=68888 RepID=A0A085NC97_9BILA|nr:hypothetical protein M513_07408 [Trichuris suis]KFD67093.1 hypothetical protein M514_07408 [Trichuris suis]